MNWKEIKSNPAKYKELYLTLFILLSLYLSLAENIIPKPFPWLKIGLANIVILVALEKFGARMAVEVVLLRIFIQGVLLGTVLTPTFIISLGAGLVSLGVVISLYKLRKYLSLVAISMVGAFFHNLVQMLIAYVIMFRGIDVSSRGILYFVFIFLLLGVVSGGVIGLIVEKINLNKEI